MVFCMIIAGTAFSYGKKTDLTRLPEETQTEAVIETSEEIEEMPAYGESRSANEIEEIAEETAQHGKVNINSADTEELKTLNGIGDARAKAIVDYRNEYGSFESIESIMNVPGIKEGIFSKIKNEITV